MLSHLLASTAPIWLAKTFLLSLRLAVVFGLTPVMRAIAMPVPVRMLLILALSIAIGAGQPEPTLSANEAHAIALDGGSLLGAALSELVLGTTLALGVLLAFGAVSVAGNLLDIQIGYGIAQVVDPLTNRQIPILTSVFNQFAILLFFLLNGHHALLRGVAYSLDRFPPGAPWSLADSAEVLLRQAGGLFSLGFALASPVVFCLLLVELALGVIARNLPQINMFTMGIPVKIVVGLTALAFWFTGLGETMARIYASIYDTWNQAFLISSPGLQGAQ